MKLWWSWWSVHIDSLAQDYAVAQAELKVAVSKCDSLHQSGPDGTGDEHLPLPLSLSSFPCSHCRTHYLISRWLLRVKLSVQGLVLHLSLRSDLSWCLWILEHLSWDEDLLFLPLLLLACMDHVNVFQYETLGFRALHCRVSSFCQHLLQVDEYECFVQVVSYHTAWTLKSLFARATSQFN